MLGYVRIGDERGTASLLLAGVADGLARDGIRLAGAVQINTDRPDCACDVDLRILGDAGPSVRISQSLGAAARGCRLDPGALEDAAHRVSRALAGADLLIVNKFGKQEAEGRGFRTVIAEALDAGVPVLTAVAGDQAGAFRDFAGDLAEEVRAERALAWCRDVLAQ